MVTWSRRQGGAARRVRWRGLVALALPWLAAGCATPGAEPPLPAPRSVAVLGLAPATAPAAVPAPGTASAPAGAVGDAAAPAAADAGARAGALPATWWQALGDPALDALVRAALADQPGPALARARLARAEALAASLRAGQGPQAALTAELTHQRYAEHGLVPPAVAGAARSSAQLQAGLVWSPDLWGRQAAEQAAAAGEARATAAEAALADTGVAGDVVQAYLGLARRLAEQALAERQQARHARLVQQLRQRVEAGLESAQALAGAEAAAPAWQARQLVLAEQVAALRRQLALLSGQPPEALAGLAPRLEALVLAPLPPAPGLDLLGRRPDVAAARWRVEAAARLREAAHTRFYPDVSLGAFIGLSALGLDRLLDLGSRQWGVAPALRLPLFDGGQLRAQQGVRRAELDAALAQYDATVLAAVREARDALGWAEALERQAAGQAEAVAAAATGHRLAAERHAAGLSGLRPVLEAEAHWLAHRAEALDLLAQRLQARVRLWQALGGGWADEAAAGAAVPGPASVGADRQRPG